MNHAIATACAAQLDDLGHIARINDQTRVVVDVSRSMNLIAINAMLTAKQAGERARGFTVVAGEMRVFSRQLDVSMEVLHAAISRLVHDVAFLRKEQRHLRYLAVTRDMAPANRLLLGPAMERCEARLRETGAAGMDAWGKLCQELRQAFRLAQMALSLARSAKIESVYGGGMTASLKQVAEEIDATAQRIMDGVKLLNAYTSN
jgi:hypothetical protein